MEAAKVQHNFPGKNPSSLMLAVINGAKKEELQKLLKDVGKRDGEGHTALMYAVFANNQDAFELLLDKERRMQDKKGVTALILAAHLGHVEYLKKLKEHEQDLTDCEGSTALLTAAASSTNECVSLLIDTLGGRQNRHGMTALMAAAFCNNVEGVKLLVDKEKGKSNQTGVTALIMAASAGRIEVVHILKDIPEERDATEPQQRWDALYFAASVGHAEICKELLEGKDNPSSKYQLAKDGSTPLMLAAEQGHTEAVKILICFAGKRRNDGVTALMLAAIGSHTDTGIALVELESGLETSGFTALMAAAEKGNLPLCKALFAKENGKTDRKGNPALFYAIQNGHANVVEVLLQSEAERNAQNADKAGAVATAICNDQPEILQLLLQHEDTKKIFDEMLTETFLYGGKKKVEPGEENQDDVEGNGKKENKYGLTPLMYAICQGATKCSKFFIQYEGGKYLKRQEETYGNTAMIYAVLKQNLDIVKLLLPHESKQATFQGRTALMIAAQSGYTAGAEILLESEANMRDMRGFTALAIAASNRNVGVVRLLLSVEGGELQGPQMQPAIFEAIKVGGDDVFVEMMAKESKIVDQNGLTGLMIAATFGHKKALDLLKTEQAGKQDKAGNTALMFAAQVGNLYAVKALIKTEAGITNSAGTTALMAAALMSRTECVKQLMKAESCRINVMKQTALIIAIENRHLESAQLLLDYEGDVYVYDGRTNILVESFRSFPNETKFIEAVIKKISKGYRVLTSYEDAAAASKDQKIIKQPFTGQTITDHNTAEATPADFITDLTPKRIRQALESL